MARSAFHLPTQLKQEAGTWAAPQGLTLPQIAVAYDIPVVQVQEALAFSTAHREEIDAALTAADALEAMAHASTTPAS